MHGTHADLDHLVTVQVYEHIGWARNPAALPIVTFKSMLTHVGPRMQVTVNPENLKTQDEEDKLPLNSFVALTNGTYLEMGGLEDVSVSFSSSTKSWNAGVSSFEVSDLNYQQLVMNRAICGGKRRLHVVEDGVQ